MLGPVSLPRRQFASDNYAGIAPEAWEALERANQAMRQLMATMLGRRGRPT